MAEPGPTANFGEGAEHRRLRSAAPIHFCHLRSHLN